MHTLRRCILLLGLLAPALLGQTAPAKVNKATAPDLIEVGKDNWQKPWVPDLKAGKGEKPITADRRIDVLILGDGYLASERARFARDVEQWYAKFVSLTPWQQLRGAFRVRGLWTPSEGRANAEGKSYFQLDGTTAGADTGARIHTALRAADCNLVARSGQLTHTTVLMLIRDQDGRNPSGMTRGARDPESKLEVRVGYGAYTHHEFGHAYGGLKDEYIKGEGSRGIGRTPDRLSIYTLSNLSFRTDPEHVPWQHLMPGSAINPDQDSVIGVLWQGGAAEQGVWHPEGRCMMNGSHENWDFPKAKRGVNLRDQGQFCFWCEEIIVARTWERTGQFGGATDGQAMYATWQQEVRPLYQAFFEVPKRIAERNAKNRAAEWQKALLFERPQAVK